MTRSVTTSEAMLQFLSAGPELVTVATNLVNPSGHGHRAAVKHRQARALAALARPRRTPDEAIPAD